MNKSVSIEGVLVGKLIVRLLLISLAGLERRYGSGEKEGKVGQQDEGNQS